MIKLAIIGASYLQLPLINKAKELGLETHVFAWRANDVGELAADFFYPISITEKEEILEKCRDIKIDGICSIASDLAMLTVNYVAQKMGLIANSLDATEVSTNKHLMRLRFGENGDPSPFSYQVTDISKVSPSDFSYPVIVKPEDRSGSRGISKVSSEAGLLEAVKVALELSLSGHALIEEFVDGDEYSAESISYNGNHKLLAITKKYTTGAPRFIECGHLEPAFFMDSEDFLRIKKIVFHALDGLGIKYGASHTEFKITSSGDIKIIEIGGRMGGDCIGSSLVELSTGVDFVKAVIDVSLAKQPILEMTRNRCAAIKYIFSDADIEALERIRLDPDVTIENECDIRVPSATVSDSSSRSGFYIITADSQDKLLTYM